METVNKNNSFSNFKLGAVYKKYGIWIVLVFFVVTAGLVNDRFFTWYNISNVLRQVSINGLLAIGMTFVILNGCIDLSVGSTLGASGIIIMVTMPVIGGFWASMLGLAFGLMVGVVNGLSVYQGMPPFIMTLATQQVVKGIAYVVSGGRPYAGSDEGYKVIGQGFAGVVPIPVIVLFIVVLIAYFILRRTAFGRSVYAVGGNSEAARLSGINVRKIRVMVFMVSGLLSSLAAIVLTSRLYSAEPLLGENYQSDAIAATVIGGTSMAGGEGSIIKTVAGILIIGIISNLLNLMRVSSYTQIIAKGIIIFIAVAIDTWKKR